MITWNRVPLFLYLLGIAGLSMLPPAFLATIDADLTAAQPFLVGALILVTLSFLMALSLNGRGKGIPAREQLLALLGAFTVLPFALSWPLMAVVPGMGFVDGYLEITSSLTTTGITTQSESVEWTRAVHLWRAELGWLGGLLVWVAAIAILAPLRIGGVELLLPPPREERQAATMLGDRLISPMQRIARSASMLAKIYIGLTFGLWLCLVIVGEDPFVAICHAMSTLSTSGISPVGGLAGGDAGMAGEAAVFVFFIFAITRHSFASDLPKLGRGGLRQDPEIRSAIAAVVLVTVVLFIRHWYALVETAEIIGVSLIPRAVWGAVFTTASFLTTTGFVSEQWELARLWAGLSTPGMVLMGLSLIGGGVATAAGGVKLLRIYVLYKHGQREVSRLVHPSAVGGIGTRKRPVRQEAAYMAWLFFMLVALSITMTMMALSLVGVAFEHSTILTIATISNTGPLVDAALAVPLSIVAMSDPVKWILCGAMVLGRLETLAIIALFNPDFWRR